MLPCHSCFTYGAWGSKEEGRLNRFFLLKAYYPSLQNSYFGNISRYRNDRSHMKIILTLFFV